MKKLSIFASTRSDHFVSCKGKESNDDDMMDEGMQEQVDSNASDDMSDAGNADSEDLHRRRIVLLLIWMNDRQRMNELQVPPNSRAFSSSSNVISGRHLA